MNNNDPQTVDTRFESVTASQQEAPDDSTLRWQLETLDTLEQTEHIFRGERWNPKKQSFEPIKGVEAVLNETGISRNIGLMHGVLNKVNVQGNLDPLQVDQKSIQFSTAAAENLFMNGQDWSLTDNHLSLVWNHMDLASSIFLSRLKEGKDRELSRGIQKFIERASGLPINKEDEKKLKLW